MRVLVALTYYYPHWTGLTAYAQRLAEGLAARGHEVTVATSRFRRDLAPEEIHQGVHIIRLRSWLRLSRGQVTPALLPLVRRMMNRCDVVQTHTPFLETWPIGMLAHRAGKKMLMTHHGDLVMPAGLWDQFVQRCMDVLLNGGANTADVISTHSRDYVEHSAYLRPFAKKVVAIYPPVEMPRPDPQAAAAWRRSLGLDGSSLIGFAGRFVEEKGFDYLLKAIPMVLARFPSAKFAYAGEPAVYEGFYGRWKHLMDRHKSNVVMMGLITSPQKMADFYSMCDVFALPSRSDCFPSVQIEAMLCGTPVVATDIPGAREVVSVTEMGLLVAPHDERALANGLVAVLADRDQYVRPYEAIRAVFATDKSVSAYESLLKSMVR